MNSFPHSITLPGSFVMGGSKLSNDVNQWLNINVGDYLKDWDVFPKDSSLENIVFLFKDTKDATCFEMAFDKTKLLNHKITLKWPSTNGQYTIDPEMIYEPWLEQHLGNRLDTWVALYEWVAKVITFHFNDLEKAIEFKLLFT